MLDAKIQRLRNGEYEHRGLPQDIVVLPCIVSFDNVGESGILYRWLAEECARRGVLSARPGVRRITVLTPEDYEGLMSLAAEGLGVCRLLVEKTDSEHAEGNLDQFLYVRAPGQKLLRLPSMRPRYEQPTNRAIARMQVTLGALEAERARQRGDSHADADAV